MDAPRRRGLIIGLFLILYMVGSGIVDFKLDPSHGQQLALTVALGILTEALWLAIAVIAYPILRPRSPKLALLFVALGVVILILGLIENIGRAEGREVEWAHLGVRMVHGAAMCVFYLALYRLRGIPCVLAGAGVIASLLQIAALAMPLFGHAVMLQLLAPTGFCQLVLALWLIAKGIVIGRGGVRTVP